MDYMRRAIVAASLFGVLAGGWALGWEGQMLAQDAPAPLFTDATPDADQPVRAPGATRSRLVTFDIANLLRPASDRPENVAGVSRITLNLFPDTVLSAVLDRLETGTEGFVTWVGHLADDDLRLASFTVRGSVMAGTVQTSGATYVLRSGGAGLTRIMQVDTSRVLPDGEPLVHSGLAAAPPPAVPDDGSTIDVLMLFTRATRNALGGAANVTAWINQQVANANTAYANSQVVHRLRLVGIRDAEQGGSSNTAIDLDRLTTIGDGYFDEIHGIRNAVQADLVHLVIANATDACGIAHLMEAGQNVVGFGIYGFSVGVYNCDFKFTFAHELGHNMGANHAPVDPVSATPVAPYAFGYKDAVGGFRTLMAYACEDP